MVYSSETRYKGASCALTGIPLARLHLSKVAAVNLPASGAICNPSPRFDVTLFGLFGQNAIRRNTLSPLRFALSPCLSFVKKGRRRPLTMPPLMVRGGVEQSETEGIRSSEAEQTIPQAALPPAPFAQGSHGWGCRSLPTLLHKGAKVWRGRCRATNHASPYGKGRCRAERDGGDKKFGSRTDNPSGGFAAGSLCTREPGMWGMR